MDQYGIQADSASWKFFVKVSFAIAASSVITGIIFLDIGIYEKGFLSIGTLFLTSSSFMLSKTMRDEHEANKLINQIKDVKNEKILKEFGNS